MMDYSDTYVSELLALGGNIFKNGQGGSAVKATVRANGTEKDPLPAGCTIGEVEPYDKTDGVYWWCITTINNKPEAVLMKRKEGSWYVVDMQNNDPQTFTYTWSLMNKDGTKDNNFSKTGKVIYVSCDEINGTGTLQCDVIKKN